MDTEIIPLIPKEEVTTLKFVSYDVLKTEE